MRSGVEQARPEDAALARTRKGVITIPKGKSSGGKSGGSKSGGHYRSAISGRYVTAKHGQSSPRTTVKESTKK